MKQGEIFKKYFADYSRYRSVAEKRLSDFQDKLEYFLSFYDSALKDESHPDHLIADFISFGDDALNRPEPITRFELREIAGNRLEGYEENAKAIAYDYFREIKQGNLRRANSLRDDFKRNVVQEDRFKEWMSSRSFQVYLDTYMALRSHVVRKTNLLAESGNRKAFTHG